MPRTEPLIIVNPLRAKYESNSNGGKIMEK